MLKGLGTYRVTIEREAARFNNLRVMVFGSRVITKREKMCDLTTMIGLLRDAEEIEKTCIGDQNTMLDGGRNLLMTDNEGRFM
ncbi:hypothetical protein TSUD_186860 [Trifolium subterraneum]|uniref:Uncharacterized protein n=1 Tax=Trifolium subterraneum TaxID=3900 RepID=A0A2Z6P2H1_TRISU|nr:hypothetical protein TSUD_186860 [Trifolium subterraneum]